MRAEFGFLHSFKQGVYGAPLPGHFALEVEPPKQCHWDHCREKFALKWNVEIDGFYFSHRSGESENVAGFISKTEEILDLVNLKTPWEKSLYNKTDRDTILWIKPSTFWKVCEVRRSLFTILLRCGMLYSPERDNYEETLFGKEDSFPQGQEYINSTKLAVKRFLFGFTKYNKISSIPTYYSGWVTIFKDRELDTIREMLVLPEGEDKFNTLIGVEAIWG